MIPHQVNDMMKFFGENEKNVLNSGNGENRIKRMKKNQEKQNTKKK